MSMTMIEKILARASGRPRVGVGDVVVCEVDKIVLIDLPFVDWIEPLRMVDPERLIVVIDHAVPAPSVADAQAAATAREFVKRWGIRQFFDVGRHGISHQVLAENGIARPGEVLACTDSHTCAAGAFNTAARGLGPLEMLSIACRGHTWYRIAPTLRYELEGTMPPGVSGKDVFLHIANEYGEATNHNVEFGGPGVAGMPLNDRRTIATQGAEIGADFTTFPADEVVRDHLRGRTEEDWEPAHADPDASYAAVRRIELDQISPYVARPGRVIGNAVPVSDVEDVRLDQCFIGSCANGQIEDLRIAAEILDGQQVAPGVRLIVTPASQAVYLEAVQRGYVATLSAAGALVTNSTCGACFGYHMGVLARGEVCLTASTRNFRGRMGSPDSDVWMASPATVAASAVTGRITDARQLVGS
jgi:3-isopropylmalate/(R)-2-methylmalate dehydratase large subunit